MPSLPQGLARSTELLSKRSLTLSIVIPVYNGGEKFRQCLVSLQQFMPAGIEVIVVADGETDGSGDLAEAFGL